MANSVTYHRPTTVPTSWSIIIVRSLDVFIVFTIRVDTKQTEPVIQPPLAEPRLRIEDLATECDIGVDTIRFYQRKGLLPAGVRAGRHKLYGARHLVRIQRIRALQEQGFSLAGIRSLLDAGVPTVLRSVLDDEHSGRYTHRDLREASDLPAGILADLEEVGFITPPAGIGREHYDEADLAVLESLNDLLDAGLSRELLVRLADHYTTAFERLETEMLELLAGGDQDTLSRLLASLEADPPHLLRLIENVLNYLHGRTLERLMHDLPPNRIDTSQ